MSPELLIFSMIIILSLSIAVFILNRKLSRLQNTQTDQTLLQWLQTMQQTLNTTNNNVNSALQNNSASMSKILQENARALHERLDKTAEVMRDVNREVGKVSEIGRNMQELQDFLRSPKLRGNIGEQVLTDLIAQVFPKNSFHLQYQFRSGEKVDAAIQTDAGILPIDAKFPLENFQKMVKSTQVSERETFRKIFHRDVKRHIDAIAKKYILPQEGTIDFALMYIPSESVFYEIIGDTQILEYAKAARVYLVSPTTLYAHLQTILLSFEGKKIETRSREVFRLLRSIKIDYDKVQESFDILGKHLTNASGQYQNVTRGFQNLGLKLNTTSQIESETKNPLLDSTI